MAQLGRMSAAEFVLRQLQTQRQNFASVCRLAVKSLTDRSSFGIIEEGCKELENFLSVLEHILNHRVKPSNTWYGAQEPRSFWDFVRNACRRVPHNCLSSIESLHWPQTSHGKGRVWIRMCLMEKRLSDYVSVALQQTKLIESFYDEGSIMLSDDVTMLADLLLGLNVLDFSFDIKGVNLDYPVMPVIDYTPYLKYETGMEGSYPEIKSVEREISGEELGSEFWKSNYNKLQEQLKRTNEQKNYLDEMLRLREAQLDDIQSQRQRLLESMQYLESERSCDRTQLEAIVVELQSQISHLKNENKDYLKKVHMLSRQNRQKEPTFSMSELIELENRDSADLCLDTGPSQSTANTSSAPMSAQLEPVSTAAADAQSIWSSTSTGSVLPSREDTLSTAVLAGSFTSQATGDLLPPDNEVFASEPELMVNQVEPMVNQVEPMVNQVEPMVNQVEPMVNQVEPMVNQPEPMVDKPEPVQENVS